jgi:hypothetical protein
MKETVEKMLGWFDRGVARFKLALIFLLVLALVAAPYAFDVSKGKFAKTYAIAKDGDDDGGDDGGGDDDGGDDDGGGDDGDDDDNDDDDGDDDDDNDDDDDDDKDDDDDNDDDDGDEKDDEEDKESRGSRGKRSDDSNGDRSGDRGPRFIGVGDVEGLTPVSAEDEEDLVGNWGESESK